MNSKRAISSLMLLASIALIGCEEIHQKPTRALTISEGSKVVAEGVGDLKFHVPEDGRVFVYDVDAAAAITVTHVRAGQEYVLSPDANVATLDGRQVVDKKLKRGHAYRLYFEKE